MHLEFAGRAVLQERAPLLERLQGQLAAVVDWPIVALEVAGLTE